jgi:hypothetical protein
VRIRPFSWIVRILADIGIVIGVHVVEDFLDDSCSVIGAEFFTHVAHDLFLGEVTTAVYVQCFELALDGSITVSLLATAGYRDRSRRGPGTRRTAAGLQWHLSEAKFAATATI